MLAFREEAWKGGTCYKSSKDKPKDNLLIGNIIVFTSSTGEQSLLPFRDKQHGMFTYCMLKINKTKENISYDELYNL